MADAVLGDLTASALLLGRRYAGCLLKCAWFIHQRQTCKALVRGSYRFISAFSVDTLQTLLCIINLDLNSLKKAENCEF